MQLLHPLGVHKNKEMKQEENGIVLAVAWGVSKARFIKAINIAPAQSAKVLLYANLIPGDKVKVKITEQLRL